MRERLASAVGIDPKKSPLSQPFWKARGKGGRHRNRSAGSAVEFDENLLSPFTDNVMARVPGRFGQYPATLRRAPGWVKCRCLSSGIAGLSGKEGAMAANASHSISKERPHPASWRCTIWHGQILLRNQSQPGHGPGSRTAGDDEMLAGQAEDPQPMAMCPSSIVLAPRRSGRRLVQQIQGTGAENGSLAGNAVFQVKQAETDEVVDARMDGRGAVMIIGKGSKGVPDTHSFEPHGSQVGSEMHRRPLRPAARRPLPHEGSIPCLRRER